MELPAIALGVTAIILLVAMLIELVRQDFLFRRLDERVKALEISMLPSTKPLKPMQIGDSDA